MPDQHDHQPQPATGAPGTASGSHVVKWLASTEKPVWMTATSSHLVAVLLAKGADSHPLTASLLDLATMCSCSPDTAKRGMTPLIKHTWVKRLVCNGTAHEWTLTGEYLSCLNVSIEVTQDTKDFTSWFHGVQKTHIKDIRPRNRKTIGSKGYEFRDHKNAAKILAHCGSVDEAKKQTEFAISNPTFHKTALQSLYNLRGVLRQESFKDAFTHGVTIPVADEEAPPQKLIRLREELATAEETLSSLRKHLRTVPKKVKAEDAVAEQEKVVKAANDAAACHAMTMGISPESAAFPCKNWTQYQSQFREMQKAKAEAQAEAEPTSQATGQIGGQHVI